MALDFPNTPTNGQIFTTGDGSWLWDTVKWKSGNGVGFLTTIADTPPPVPTPGLLWWNSSPGIGQLYVYYNDGTSSQWVTANNMGGGLYLPLTGGTIGVQPVTGPGPNALLINDTATQPQPNADNPKLWLASETLAAVSIDNYGASAVQLKMRHARGTAAAPTAVQNGDNLAVLGAIGYGTSFTTTYSASITFGATETWTGSANGTNLQLATIPTGTNAAINSLVLAGNAATFSGTVAAPGGIVGVTNGSSAAAGMVGELQTASSTPNQTLATSNTNYQLASLNLPAGQWIVWGMVQFTNTGGFTLLEASITSGYTGNTPQNVQASDHLIYGPTLANGCVLPTGIWTANLSATGLAAVNVRAIWASATTTVSTTIYALRVR
jgi:hypothetical protein